jgi:DNA ligase D-like protein (predicted 3'-phosphoesterase)
MVPPAAPGSRNSMPAKTATRDSLERYRAKRDFLQTGEPSGGAVRGTEPTALRYLVQKHDASRLHYDFRLELGGTLKSWAVTKGPSLDPADKRLAVHVEDHPIEYGSFEGTIPEGQYGGGTVMLWDEGTWAPIGDPDSSYKNGRLTFVLHGKRLNGEWHLVRMGGRTAKRDNWLLIKSHDEYADEKNGDSALERYDTSAASGRSMIAIARRDNQWRPAKAMRPRRPRAAARVKNKEDETQTVGRTRVSSEREKTVAKKAAKKRKYSRSAGSDVKSEARRYKKGTAKSGPGGKGGKVKSRKQAIAIGLSKARKKGKKVPKKRTTKS